ncbi:MAG: roadblock/LC7 domain-containing protein [Methanobacteriales archaeon]|nr:roadblock/LC7 domain-containing protein [Methanobacteriales archaeon]
MDIFDEIYQDFKKVNGFNGIMVMDDQSILYDRITLEKMDKGQIESMARVINESSRKLLKRTGQGRCKTIILEFQESKMILLDIEDIHIIVIADKGANLGHIILVSEKNRKKLHRIEKTPTISEKVTEAPIKGETTPTGEVKSLPEEGEEATPPEEPQGLPEIKPPISLPTMEKEVEVPAAEKEKIGLVLEIYENILLAMSIGASKIMGVAPARGMLRKSLPYNECPQILEGVEVKANAAIEFDTIRSNIEKSQNRVEDIIEGLNGIIWAITENYGRVMGYDAFRGMIRPEFKSVHKTYGTAMEKLGIINGIHPELRKIWEESS